jgi:predicted ABC-type ATPase
VARTSQTPCIYVLAGTNGAGKSSIAGAMFRYKGAEYFNPDEAAFRMLAANPALTCEQANSAAWNEGKRLLERAIDERCNFAFETTLGGRSIAALLEKVPATGIAVRVWYVGLSSSELHIARVRARVKKGGHDIPEARIRERFVSSRWNLIRLLPRLTEIFVYDNSEEADPSSGSVPEPKLILHAIKGKVAATCNLKQAPDWAKPILMAALRV